MNQRVRFAAALSIALVLSVPALAQARDPYSSPSWPQWGQNAQHAGSVPVVGQAPRHILADIVYDPFVAAQQAESDGDLLAHYPVPLVDGKDVFIELKTGTYVPCDPVGSGLPYPCGPDAWDHQIWNVERLHWNGDHLGSAWTFQSDWKPEPNEGGWVGWEPVFHPALTKDYLFVPGAGGTVWKVDRATGVALARLNPFGSAVDPNTFVAGPLTIDGDGRIYYNVIKLDPGDPWSGSADVAGAWLVKISGTSAGGHPKYAKADYKTLIPGAPTSCNWTFSYADLPWPPSPGAAPGVYFCGSQRPGLNVAPAVAPDGTIYTVSRAHFNDRYGYLVALRPDLTLKWAASLRGRLDDGCNNDAGTFPGSVLPANGAPGGCRAGSTPGVDPSTNESPAGRVIDQSSSSPTVAPDGRVLYGAYTRYNYARGALFDFKSDGTFLGSYGFGWDSTPAIYRHGKTYSIVIKDNHYGGVGSYCNDDTACPPSADGPFFITQLSPGLTPEWQFQSTNTLSCHRNPNNSVTCVSDHPNGFEWCINAPAIDANGNVYANSEDGNVYEIRQGGTLVARKFTNLAIGAAYTPLAIGPDGRIYTQNDGHLFVLGR